MSFSQVSIIEFKKEKYPGLCNDKAEWIGTINSGTRQEYTQPVIINPENGLIIWGTQYCGYAPLTALTAGKAFKLRQICVLDKKCEIYGYNYYSEDV